MDYEAFVSAGSYQPPALIQPYFTITNVSDSAYAIYFDGFATVNDDAYFEPGEGLFIPAALCPDANNSANCDWNILYSADKTFVYPTSYRTTTNEPFVWSSADIYYNYILPQ